MCNLYLYLIVFIVPFNASESIKRNNYNNKNNGRRCRLSISKNAKRGAKKQKVGIGRTTTLHVLHPVFIVTFNASESIKRNNYNNNNNGRRCRLSISKNAKRGAKKQKVGIGKTTTLHVLHPGGGGSPVFQVTGMMEGFFGVSNVRIRDFIWG